MTDAQIIAIALTVLAVGSVFNVAMIGDLDTRLARLAERSH